MMEVYGFTGCRGGAVGQAEPHRLHTTGGIRLRHVTKTPLQNQTHWPLLALSAVLILYGLLTLLVSRLLSAQAMRGVISVGQYQSRLSGFNQAAGLTASLLLLALFIWCAALAAGIARTAFIIGALAASGPFLVAHSSTLLFNILKLPTMGAGSVLAAAMAALAFGLPLMLTFILLAARRRNLRSIRWLSLVSVLVVLAAVVFPLFVTVLALLIRPGDPGLAPLMNLSAYLLHWRFILSGLSLFLIGLCSLRLAAAGRREPSDAAASQA
jgi:hypothetical protein